MLVAGPLDRAAADDPLGVREEHHLQEHRRRIRGGPGVVVPEPRVEVREIEFVIGQVVQRVLERPREQLPREIDGQEPRVGIDVLVAGHGRGGRRATERPCSYY